MQKLTAYLTALFNRRGRPACLPDSAMPRRAGRTVTCRKLWHLDGKAAIAAPFLRAVSG